MDISLLEQGFTVLCVGFCIVFMFLCILIVAMGIMSKIVGYLNKIFPSAGVQNVPVKAPSTGDDEIAVAIAAVLAKA